MLKRLDEMTTLKYVVLAVAVVAALVSSALALRTPDVPDSDLRATDTRTTSATEPSSSPSTAPAATTSMTILSDSFLAGTAQLVADGLGYDLDDLAEDGSGYTSAGPGGTFAERVDAVTSTNPGVVMIVAGLSDYDNVYRDKAATPAQLETAVSETLSGLVAALPGAKLVVVGPFWTNGKPPAGARSIDTAVREQAQALGLTFVDPIGEEWITDDNAGDYLVRGRGRLTPAGQSYLADKLVEAVRATNIG